MQSQGKRKVVYPKIKRILDFVISILGIVILSPVFLVIILLIKLDSRGPVLFKQRRIGINKKEFNILKFRTMKTDTPKDMPTHLLDNPEIYITRIGKFLRKTSLDELPQIINIIKGEMSIIGPRPALWNQFDLIKERDKYSANDITPGLTGWAQINGRNSITWTEKFNLDVWYVKYRSFLLDLKIIFLTVKKVIIKEGINQDNNVTMEYFNGTN